MKQLELLWKLQEHDLKLKETKAKLEELAKKGSIETITLKLNSLDKRLKDKKLELEEKDKKLRKNDNILKGLTFQLKEVEKNLYDGTVTDVKQLNYMAEESKSLKEHINELEFDIIYLMEYAENIKKDISHIENECNKMKFQFAKNKDEYNRMTNQIREKIRQEMDDVYQISTEIDEVLYKKYHMLKKNKVFAMAKVEEHRCNGCNMIIPTYLIDNLKRDEELQYCENCGRILYLEK
ncbi:MAG TPA: C4-type zinc ribbon domain-containing protein [Tissierellales bacterium]|nr:C4-type zinc ribbon domain-containing protein [Tissierellales bacterium]